MDMKAFLKEVVLLTSDSGLSHDSRVFALDELLKFNSVQPNGITAVVNNNEYIIPYPNYITIRELLLRDRLIQAIKEFRTVTGLGLKESKDWVENLRDKENLRIIPDDRRTY